MAESHLEFVKRTTGRQLREALLEVGTHLGWDHQTVVCISETVTGRAWQRCGADDVIRVAKVLLEVAAALRLGSSGHAVSQASVAVNLDVRDIVKDRKV